MGLKSGSRDAGLDDSEEDADHEATDEILADEPSDTPLDFDRESPRTRESPSVGSGTESVESDRTDDRPVMSSIPYKLRREKVNEGREQVPYFLREEVIDGEDDLQDRLEDILGEDVYKSDYREAAMVVAQQHPELVAEVLREWGYDLESV